MPFYPTVKMCCEIVDWQEKMHYIDDAPRDVLRFVVISPEAALPYTQLPEFISSGAGFDIDEAKLTASGETIPNVGSSL